MSEFDGQLPGSVSQVSVDGKEVFLVGTAHVSKESVEDVRVTIESIQPDTVCVELCHARLKSMVERDTWEKMNIFKVIREKKTVFLFAQLILSSFYHKLGEKLGIEPGAEMLEGVKRAAEIDAELLLADRDIEITLKRVWGSLTYLYRMKMMFHFLYALLENEDIDEETIEKMKKSDQLESMIESFAQSYPEVKKKLLDERDVYLSQKIRKAPGNTVVAVVGAGHVPGIIDHIQKDIDLEPLNEIPPKSIVPTLFKWGIPLLIVGLFVLGYLKGGFGHFMDDISIWFMVNGTLSALGSALAFAHPLTILSSFLAAPLTSLNPMVAAGFVAGIVQAWVKKPTVGDFKAIPQAILTVKGFWMNPVTRILLVVILANTGSAIGTWISGIWIAARAS
jgi:pheromone shutdown-related protein TraB